MIWGLFVEELIVRIMGQLILGFEYAVHLINGLMERYLLTTCRFEYRDLAVLTDGVLFLQLIKQLFSSSVKIQQKNFQWI
jgi:hypothetical protein